MLWIVLGELTPLLRAARGLEDLVVPVGVLLRHRLLRQPGGFEGGGFFAEHLALVDPMDNRIANTVPLCRDCHRAAA